MKIVTLYVRVTMLVCADAIAYALALCVALAGNGMGMALLFDSEVDSWSLHEWFLLWIFGAGESAAKRKNITWEKLCFASAGDCSATEPEVDNLRWKWLGTGFFLISSWCVWFGHLILSVDLTALTHSPTHGGFGVGGGRRLLALRGAPFYIAKGLISSFTRWSINSRDE